MPKKKYEETPGEQLARCKESIQRLVDTGELDSVGAHEAFQRALRDVLEAPAEPAH